MKLLRNISFVAFVCWILLGLRVAYVVFAVNAANYVTIYEVDGVTTNNFVVGAQQEPFAHVFKKAEITTGNCPQPLVDGVAVADGNWQATIVNAWDDGSVRLAKIKFIIPTLTANSSPSITFQNGTCNTSGLSQAQMVAFNGGNWNAQNLVTAGGTTVTVDAKVMLNALSNADCQLRITESGPVATVAHVEDCTSATAYDFGWTNTAGTMATPVSGSQPTASLHPSFDLSFFPSLNLVRISFVLENDWTSRRQDQIYSAILKTGSPATQVDSIASYTHFWMERWPHKIFFSGTQQGHIRFNHNFSYLISTKLMPPYDLGVTVNPTANYTTFAASTDKGDIGQAGWAAASWFSPWATAKSYPDNSESALAQRDDLDYLYNMGVDCGTANGKCAKAWAILTGEVDSNASTTLPAPCVGSCGSWGNTGNVPFHLRESRTTSTKAIYCPGWNDKDVVPNTACGSSTTPFGRWISRDAFQTDQINGNSNFNHSTTVGTAGSSGWSHQDCSHELDYSYIAYLLTGDDYFREEEFFDAAYCFETINPSTALNQSNGFYAYVNPSALNARWWGWSLMIAGRAAMIATDGSVEQNYFTSKINSNLAVQEGFMGITGTSLTPTTIHANCSGAPAAGSANRWDWGRCYVGQNIATALHAVVYGSCPVSNPAKYGIASGSDSENIAMYSQITIALGHLYEMGYTNVQYVFTEMGKSLEERTLDPTYNPYLSATEVSALRSGAGACPGSGVPVTTNAYISTWAAELATFDDGAISGAHWQTIGTFNNGGGCSSSTAGPTCNPLNSPCADHGYSIYMREAGSFLQEFSITSGTYTATNTWNWLNTHVPYFTNSVTGSTSCGSTDVQIKHALTPQLGTDTCVISAPASGATVSGTSVTVTISCTAASGSINNIHSTLNGSTTNMPSNGTTPLSTTFDSTKFSNGTYTLGCTTTDTNGGSGSCTGQTVVILNTPVIQTLINFAVKVAFGISVH